MGYKWKPLKVKVDSFLHFSLALFAFFLPIHEKISTLFIFVCLGLSFLNWKNWNKFLIKEGVFLLALYTIYVFAYANDNLGFGFHLFERKAALLIFPLIFSFSNIDYTRFVFIIKAFVLGCVFSYFICLVHPFIFSFDWIQFEFIPIKSPNGIIFENENYNWLNYFTSLNFTNTIDRAYFACYSVFALTFVLLFRKEYEKREFTLLVVFLLFAIIQIHSISGFLSATAVCVLFVFSIKDIRKKIALFGLFSGIVLISILYSPRLKEYVGEVKDLVTTGELDDHFLNERFAFWKNAITVYKKKPIIGNGIKTAQKLMNEEHERTLNWSPEWVKEVNFNAHNQYLQFLIESGLIGLIIYLFTILWFLFKQMKKENILAKKIAFYFMVIFSLHLLSESMIYRYLGISFFSFFYCLLLVFNPKIEVVEQT